MRANVSFPRLLSILFALLGFSASSTRPLGFQGDSSRTEDEACLDWTAGRKLLEGEATPESLDRALALFAQAAEKGCVRACSELGMLYLEGRDGSVARDDVQAFQWFKQAADAGDLDALHHCGLICRDGSNVACDAEQAVRYFREAAKRGHLPSQFSLAWTYEHGLGVMVNLWEAVRWYQTASENFTKSCERN